MKRANLLSRRVTVLVIGVALATTGACTAPQSAPKSAAAEASTWVMTPQVESVERRQDGLMLAGPQLLDWSANGREWRRIGNRSPFKPAAPHGAYRCRGEDRWIAIACFDQVEWQALARAAGHEEWLSDARFVTLEARLAHQDALDQVVGEWTASQEPYACMALLQQAGVAAGVCQTAEDRCDHDPQLAHQQWMTEVTARKIGTWPIGEMPFKLSATPSHMGGIPVRGAPL